MKRKKYNIKRLDLYSICKDEQTWASASDETIEEFKKYIRQYLKIKEPIKCRPVYGQWFMAEGLKMVDIEIWSNDLSKKLAEFHI